MTQDTSTYYVWIGGSCDYGHKERAGGAAVVIEHNGNLISRDVISDLHTTEFRMMLTLMVKVMQEIPEGSDILFLTNAAYIQNFDKAPTVNQQTERAARTKMQARLQSLPSREGGRREPIRT